jgi:hypothetical protein
MGNYYLTWTFALITMSGMATIIPDSGETEILVISFGSNFVDKANSMIVDEEGNIYVTGSFQGDLILGDEKYTAMGDADIFLAKFNSDGNIEWFRQAGSRVYEKNVISESGNAVQLDYSGNVVICGVFAGQAYFGDTIVQTKGGSDVFVAKYNNAGSLLWVSTFGNHGCNICNNLLVDNESIYIAGTTNGTLLDDPISQGKSPVFLGALDRYGKLEWLAERSDTIPLMTFKTMLAWQNNQLVFGTISSKIPTKSIKFDEKPQYYLEIELIDKKGNTAKAKAFDLISRPDFDFIYESSNQLLLIDHFTNKTVSISELSESFAQYFQTTAKMQAQSEMSPSARFFFNEKGGIKDVLYRFDSTTYLATTTNKELILNSYSKIFLLLENLSVARVVKPVFSSDSYQYLLINYFGGFNEELGINNINGGQDILLLRMSKKEKLEFVELNENNSTNLISLFPNPSQTGIFQVEVKGARFQECESILIFNHENKQVKVMSVSRVPKSIDLSELPAGQYLVVFRFSDNEILKKVIVL